MKRLIIFVFSICFTFIACKSKLQTIEGKWVYDKTENNKTDIMANLGAFMFLGEELQFKDEKCIITSFGTTKLALDIEEGKNSLYLKYEGASVVINIIDSNTIGVDIMGNTIIYKRKK